MRFLEWVAEKCVNLKDTSGLYEAGLSICTVFPVKSTICKNGMNRLGFLMVKIKKLGV